jgi:hypothetical protein
VIRAKLSKGLFINSTVLVDSWISGAVSSVIVFREIFASSINRPTRITAYEIAIAITRSEQAAMIVATPPGPVTIF